MFSSSPGLLSGSIASVHLACLIIFLSNFCRKRIYVRCNRFWSPTQLLRSPPTEVELSNAFLRNLDVSVMLSLQGFIRPCHGLSRRHFSAHARLRAKYAPKRGSFKQLTPSDVEAFAGMVSNPASSILSTMAGGSVSALSPEELQSYNQDWMAKYSGNAPLVLRPRSTEEVSKIVAYCWQNNIAITPQGGNTGLVGGSVPTHDEVILSMVSHSTTMHLNSTLIRHMQGLMDKIRSFDEVSGILKVDAGAILQSTDDFLASKGYIFPLSVFHP